MDKPLKVRNQFSRADKLRKREEAEARNAAYQALTPQQRLARLDAAFGPSKGAARERLRISNLIAAQKKAEIAAAQAAGIAAAKKAKKQVA
jgi:hypothetical protein